MNGRLILACVCFGLGLVCWTFARRTTAWEQRAQRAQEFAAAQTARADSASRAADLASAHADSVVRAADARAAVVVERIKVVREVAVPDTCVQFVAPRDSIIDELVAIDGQREAAYGIQALALAALRTSNTALRAGNDSLSAVIAARPRPRSWLIPEPGIGIIAGLCQSGPCYGVGVTLSWRIGL